MENYHLNEFNLDFEFDFQHDFTSGENRVIDDILSNSIPSGEIFEAGQSLMEVTREDSSFFEYLCNDSGSASDLGTLEQLPANQLFPVESETNQASYEVANFATESNGTDNTADDQNVSFDWTTFLDKSPSQKSVEEQSSENEPSEPVPIDRGNVIRDNGFIYQELKTLDIPQMYANLGETFGLADLKKIDERMNYSSLPAERRSNQNDRTAMNNMTNVPLTKKKVFLMPLQMDRKSTESLLNVANNLKSHPDILNSMLSQCSGREFTKEIRLPNRPKQIKQKSQRHLTINEQLERINMKEVVLPMIDQPAIRRERKQILPISMERVPVNYAVEVVLTDINENNILQSNETTKMPKTKKTSPNTKSSKRENIELTEKPKKSRRLSKKLKTN